MPIVTGIVDLGRFEPRQRSYAEYKSQAAALLRVELPMFLFSEPDRRDELLAMRPANARTVWCDATFDPPAAELRAVKEGLNRSEIRWNPQKDTPHYFCLMRQKIRWLRRAAELHAKTQWDGTVDLSAFPTPGRCVYWSDIGYLHTDASLLREITAHPPAAERIRLAELSYVPKSVRHDRFQFYRSHWWPVAGGMIAGHTGTVPWLDERIETEWQWTLEHGFPATDEMMLGHVRHQHPERFELYYADHCSLLTNYVVARESHPLIKVMAKRALEDDSIDEAAARLTAILAAQ